MTMTGKGQVLVGDDEQDVKNLRLKYAGSDTGTFDFTFIKGVGEKLERTLYSMSDSLSGYVANKQKTLQNQMTKIDRRIDSMESRLTRYQETLMAKYTAMETMITQLQSQMTWLNGQIDSLGK
jgi:flagellar hook-associated protein 2